MTEVPETDHLYQAEGILQESLKLLSSFYHTKKSIYLVNGSTVGLMSAILGIHDSDDEILVARNCHQSVYNSLSLKSLKVYYVIPEITSHGLQGGIHPDNVAQILKEHPRIVSLVITSPTYEGFVSDIKSIADVCHRNNVLLIVDEAHGAHFSYSSLLPTSAIDCGADVVVHSTHKTLPVITGAGLLHMNLTDDLIKKVMTTLQKLQTSSPSYIMMAQMDACVLHLGNNNKLWKKTDLAD